MSATDDLRRLLDERGVEWANPNSIFADITTTWRDGGWEYEAVESSYGDDLSLQAEYAEWATPAQAAEMTLGRGKCKWELAHSGTLYDKWQCSCCGYEFVEPRTDQGYTELEPNFCPNCGREVER